jgi:hypothetical protein
MAMTSGQTVKEFILDYCLWDRNKTSLSQAKAAACFNYRKLMR